MDDASKKFLRYQPPTHPDDDEDEARLGYPGLLNLRVYVADRCNATTASCETRGGKDHRIQVTICAARPPLVSYLCVYCPDLEPTVFACRPRIIATEADLLLLAVAFGPHSASFKPEMYDYLVYQAAAGGSPSLHLLPHPGPSIKSVLHSSRVGILRPHNQGGDGDYIIAAALYTSSGTHFQLHLYRSKSKTWSDKPVFLQHHQQQQPFLGVHKVIIIGGEDGTVALVDLWHGMLFYDLLREGDDHVLGRYIPLPPPLLPGMELEGCPMDFRDIAVVNGRIKYVELQRHVRPSTSAMKRGTYISDGFTAAIFSRSATNPWEEDPWHQDCKFDASQMSAGNNKPELPHELQDNEGEPQPTLVRLHTGHPTLGLHDDHVLYLMTKVDCWDEKAWVLAVDTRNVTLQGVAEFTADRIPGFGYTYTHTRICEYLDVTPGTNSNLKRPGTPAGIILSQEAEDWDTTDLE